MLRDASSLANPQETRVTHLDWKVTVDFTASALIGRATYTLDRVDPDATTLCLDTSRLEILTVVDQNDDSLSFALESPGGDSVAHSHLGQRLVIRIAPATTSVAIDYRTTPASSACQWLPPAQTSGGVFPYLYTQAQAIHARSLIPCQDMPGVKFTYGATVTVPAWATPVMSAILKTTSRAHPDDSQHGSSKIYTFEQTVPISAYLLALAVGQLEKRDLSPRCAVWSEPSVVEAAAYEFAQTEEFLTMAEDLAGTPYVWGRYDLLCLCASSPYGGMENPCITFVTPTLLAGDRSLADVVAHEIAHSWTGNLVTNATWDHFWLNEGWTTWFQRKIMSRIHHDDHEQLLDLDAIGGYQALQDACSREMPLAYQKLVLDIGDGDPDEAYSSIAYEKGFHLLRALERRVGTSAFEAFFQSYVQKYAYQTLTSDDFRDFFTTYFEDNEAIRDFDWETWFYEPGMPPEDPPFDRTLAEHSAQLAQVWLAVDRHGRMLPTTSIADWTSLQTTCFLDALLLQTNHNSVPPKDPLKVSTIRALQKAYRLADSRNSEILFRFCMLAVAAEDETILPTVVRFITTQGRMKFTRPLYRTLFASVMGRDLAVQVFLGHKEFYHPICAKMVASDLLLSSSSSNSGVWATMRNTISLGKSWMWAVGGAAVAVGMGITIARHRRR
jgi:leukotriene-A4 hydrolase